MDGRANGLPGGRRRKHFVHCLRLSSIISSFANVSSSFLTIIAAVRRVKFLSKIDNAFKAISLL